MANLLAFAAILTAHAENWRRFVFSAGAGVSEPLGSTATYAGTSANFTAGVGYSFNNHSSLIGEVLWAGMPATSAVPNPSNGPSGKVNLYGVTANYRYKFRRFRDSRFGAYLIGGPGWYNRYTSVSNAYTVAPNTPCQPIFTWWGYGCTPGGFVNASSMTYKFVDAGGLNGGVGFTIQLRDSNWNLYAEPRFHHAFSGIPTNLFLVTFGLRFN